MLRFAFCVLLFASIGLLNVHSIFSQDSAITSNSDTSSSDSVSNLQRIMLETRRSVRRSLEKPIQYMNDNYLIVIDPGHGGTKYVDKGHSAKLDTVEYYEHEMMWDYAVRLETRLREIGYTSVKKTKTGAADRSLSIYTRADVAKRLGKEAGKPVIFISLHWNHFEDRSISGTEIYIKEKRNRTSRKLAEFIQGKTRFIMGAHGMGQYTEGIIERDYKVLRELDTGVLIELGYASNPNDLQKMITLRDDITIAISDGIEAFSSYLWSLDTTVAKIPTEDQFNLSESRFASIKNVSYGWSWKTQNLHPWQRDHLENFDGFYAENTTEKRIYLTFDCGYENGNTSVILDVLKAHHVHACFFITGGYLKYNRDLVKRMIDEGHVIGNHSQYHRSMPLLKVAEIKEEILGLDRDLYDLFEIKTSYFRPPSGEYSARSLAVTHALGFKTIFWSYAYDDWDASIVRGKTFAYNKIIRNVRPGDIVLLHAVSKDNADAMPDIIESLRAQGYEFVSLDTFPFQSKDSRP
ncbi:MAG: polysaccharide deacetylase family protein [Bacteroidetes bacterium]|nr:polysaccharide deacetylase family protein [Bacteroidota bacterium]